MEAVINIISLLIGTGGIFAAIITSLNNRSLVKIQANSSVAMMLSERRVDAISDILRNMGEIEFLIEDISKKYERIYEGEFESGIQLPDELYEKRSQLYDEAYELKEKVETTARKVHRVLFRNQFLLDEGLVNRIKKAYNMYKAIIDSKMYISMFKYYGHENSMMSRSELSELRFNLDQLTKLRSDAYNTMKKVID